MKVSAKAFFPEIYPHYEDAPSRASAKARRKSPALRAGYTSGHSLVAIVNRVRSGLRARDRPVGED